MALKGAKICCICKKKKYSSYHNPEPIRDGKMDCCSICNVLVCRARRKCFAYNEEERAEYLEKLRGMKCDELVAELGEVEVNDELLAELGEVKADDAASDQ